MKAIYFKLKESSLSPAASNGEKDKDGAPWCRPLYVVNMMREKEGGGRGRSKKGGRFGEKTETKSGRRQIKQAR